MINKRWSDAYVINITLLIILYYNIVTPQANDLGDSDAS